MVIVVETAAIFKANCQAIEYIEVSPYIAEKIGSTVIILAQNGVSHGVGIKCSEVIIFGLKAI